MKINIITIGDEILIGQTVDTNSAWIGEYVNKFGMKVHEILSVSDNAAHITDALNRALQQSDAVLITGGLGPTKDDITKTTLARFFNSKMVFNAEILRDIESYFTKRGRPLLDSTRSLAMVPEACEVLRNEQGTAAAMWFEQAGKIIVSMPGVPHEMRDFMQRVVVKRLQAYFNTPTIIHKTTMVAGLGESIVASKIARVENTLPPHIKLAYLPNKGILRVRLSATGPNAEVLAQEVAHYTQAIQQQLAPKYAYGYDGQAFEQHIGELLLAKNATLSTAESCTGGRIAHQITSHSGSSKYFVGGVVSYSNALKQRLLGVKASTLAEHGAVSEATVIEMAQGAIQYLQSDYALAVSGIAGPTGGTPDKPVGTVWIAVANKQRVVAKKYTFARTRFYNIRLSSNLALVQLRHLILNII